MNLVESFSCYHMLSQLPGFRTHVASSLHLEVPSERDDLPQVLRVCLCAPAICTTKDLVEIVFPDFFAAEFMGPNPKSNLA